jgi:surface carbohydrate biosynthesis protein
MSERPLVAIVVDNVHRDLPAMVLTAWHLCRRGFSCCLVPMNIQEPEFWNLAPDFVLLNYLRKNNEEMARRLMDAGMGVGILDTEGAIFTPRNSGDDAAEEYALTMAKDPAIRAGVASYFAWTAEFADFVSRKGWYERRQLQVTGTPRTDYYHASWRPAALARTRFIEDYGRPLVLVNGSFPTSNPKYQTAEQERKQLTQTFRFDEAYVDAWQKNERVCLRELASLANRLARRFPAATFIYRPHPFENEATYQFLLDDLPNLKLVRKGTVDGWMLRASALIHVSSSTAIEATLAGLPVLSPAWLPKLPVPLSDAVTHECADAAVVEARLAEVFAGKFAPDPAVVVRQQDVIRKAYDQIDGKAAERIADVVAQQAGASGRGRRMAAARRYAYGLENYWESTRQKLLKRLRAGLGLPVHWSFSRAGEVWETELPWDRTEKRFGVEDVQAAVDAIGATTPDSPPITVATATDANLYAFGYRQGRSIALTAA